MHIPVNWSSKNACLFQSTINHTPVTRNGWIRICTLIYTWALSRRHLSAYTIVWLVSLTRDRIPAYSGGEREREVDKFVCAHMCIGCVDWQLNHCWLRGWLLAAVIELSNDWLLGRETGCRWLRWAVLLALTTSWWNHWLPGCGLCWLGGRLAGWLLALLWLLDSAPSCVPWFAGLPSVVVKMWVAGVVTRVESVNVPVPVCSVCVGVAVQLR